MSTGNEQQPVQAAEQPPSPGGGRRLPRISFFSSIRFRLTAWYTLGLVIILAVLGVLLSTFLARELENEVDDRLQEASRQIVDNASVHRQDGYYVVDPSSSWVDQISNLPMPNLEKKVRSGLFVVVADLNNHQARRGTAPDDLLPALGVSPEGADQGGFRTLESDGLRIRVHVRPVYVPRLVRAGDEAVEGQPVVAGVIVVGESLARQDQVLTLLNQLLRIVGAAGVLLATWGGWILAGRTLAPVNRIAATADAIARQGDAQESLSTRLDVNHNGDELARLSQTINAMLERIERAFQAQRRFVADASHELRTPLTALRGNVDVLYRHARRGRELEPDVLEESLGEMKRESARMARLIDDLLLLARTDAEGFGHMVHPEPVSLDVIAHEAFGTAESLAHGQRLHLAIRQPLMIYGDGDRLVQVMIILLDNAMRHTPSGGTIDLIVDAAESEKTNAMCARIQVVDSGEGIPPDHLPHLFERFYRIEGSRSRLDGGSGLGLAIALAIVQGHNGWIDVASPPDGGTRFTVWLPILESPEGATDPVPLLPGIRNAPAAGDVAHNS